MKLFAKALVETMNTGFVLENKPYWIYGRMNAMDLQSISQSLAISLLVCLLCMSPYCGFLLSRHRCEAARNPVSKRQREWKGALLGRERRGLGESRFEPHPVSYLGRSQPLLASPSSSAIRALWEHPASLVGTQNK